MNRDGSFLWRVIHPTTILFFLLTMLYALGVENGILLPVEFSIRGLPPPRWLATFVFYFVLLAVVAIFFRVVANGDRFRWLDVLSSNRGGLGLFDALLIGVVAALVYLGWRYYSVFYLDLLPIVIVTALTALVGLFRSPPWRHIYIFQRDNSAVLVPTVTAILQELGQGDAATAAFAELRLQEENPGFDINQQSPGQELYVPADIRPLPAPPAAPPAPPAQAAGQPQAPPTP
jgi:hypothetical protein